MSKRKKKPRLTDRMKKDIFRMKRMTDEALAVMFRVTPQEIREVRDAFEQSGTEDYQKQTN